MRQDLLPHLDWMKHLQNLALIKLGIFREELEFVDGDSSKVSCRLLDHLLYKMFSSGPSPSSLVNLVIKDFMFELEPILAIAPKMKVRSRAKSD